MINTKNEQDQSLPKSFFKKRITTLLLSVIMFSSLSLFAQQGDITGTVVDNTNEAVIGASVILKGTSTGTVTDFDGNFSFFGDKNGVLVVSYIGYKTQEIELAGKTKLQIKLEPDTEELAELVVVGYGVQKKVNLTGSVASVNFEEQALSRPVTNVSSALAGLSSGVQVMQNSGRPGDDGASIRIRGVGTLNNSSPLVMIDGIEGNLDAVNPQDIESISVLKDAASGAIYGARAANGVILVTTKKGKKGKVNVSYSGRAAYAQPTNLIEMVSDYASYMELINESFVNKGQASHFSQKTIDLWREKSKNPNEVNELGVPNSVAFPNTDWQRELFGFGIINDQNVSISGGSDQIRFLTSVGYLSNPGLVDNTGIARYSFRTNIEVDPTNWLTVGARIFASQEDREVGAFDNANNYLRQTTPGLYPRWNGKYGYPEAPEESATANNLYKFLNANEGSYRKSRFNTTLFSRVKIVEGLSWNFNLNYKRRMDENESWTNAMSFYKLSEDKEITGATPLDKMTTGFSNYGDRSYTLENILNYNTTISEDHDVSALLGYQEQYFHSYSRGATKEGLIHQTVHTPSSATEMKSIVGGETDWASRSVFGRATYAYMSKYLLEANFRFDYHSRYHRDHRRGFFPSYSAAWRLSEEEFMEGTKSWVENIKLRASWGKLGNNGGNDVGNYEYQSAYSSAPYMFGNIQTAGLAVGAFANPVLSWETARSANFGIDAEFLNRRLTLTVDVYDKLTTGILYKPDIFLTAGTAGAPRKNIAELANKGIELTLGWRGRVNDFNYSVSGNVSYNHNQITKYKGTFTPGWSEVNGVQKWNDKLADVSTGDLTRIVEGKMMSEYYLKTPYKGTGNYFNADGLVNIAGGPKDGMIRTEQDMEWLKAMMAIKDENGKSKYDFRPNKTVDPTKIWYGDYIYADNNGDGIYGNADDSEFQNYSRHPKYNFGLQASASWKGFDLSMNFAGAAGFKLYWAPITGYNTPTTRVGLGLSKFIVDNHYFYNPEEPEDPKTNLNAKYARLTAGEKGSQQMTSSTLYLYDGDYLKLKNLTLGYRLPDALAKKIFTQSVRFYVSVENVFTLTKFPGQDPELGVTPKYTSVRSFALGTNITF